MVRRTAVQQGFLEVIIPSSPVGGTGGSGDDAANAHNCTAPAFLGETAAGMAADALSGVSSMATTLLLGAAVLAAVFAITFRSRIASTLDHVITKIFRKKLKDEDFESLTVKDTWKVWKKAIALSRPHAGLVVLGLLGNVTQTVIDVILAALRARALDLVTGRVAFQSDAGVVSIVFQSFGDAPQDEGTASPSSDASLRSTSGVTTALTTLFLTVAALEATKCLAAYATKYCNNSVGDFVRASAQLQYFSNVLSCEVGFFDKTHTSDLNKSFHHLWNLHFFCGHQIPEIAQSIISLVGSSAYMMHCDSSIGAIVICFLILQGLTERYMAGLVQEAVTLLRKVEKRANRHRTETFSNIYAVKNFSCEDKQFNQLSAILDEDNEARQALVRINAMRCAISSVLMATVSAFVWYAGLHHVVSGTVTVGQLSMFAMLMGRVKNAATQLLGTFAQALERSAYLKRSFQLMERRTAMPPRGRAAAGGVSGMSEKASAASCHRGRAGSNADGGDASDAKATASDTKPAASDTNATQITDGALVLSDETIQGRVTLRDVTFVYPSRPTTQVLKGLSLTLEPNTVTALCGTSGGGKSTLANLVLRSYDPTDGAVELDGRDLRDIDLTSYHQHTAVVAQEPTMFSTSVRDNIAFGVPEGKRVSDNDIEAAAKLANAHEFITAFEQGYDTEVGEKGVRLSGGQKQRIAIARAFLTDPKILILDEATSALDSESEHLVQEALDRVMVGRTTLVVAHRLSTIRHADNIAVVDGGKVAEQGTHENLLAKQGVYAALVERQLQGEA
eukprot:m.88935 g.88935  ORF g.88935 m.88935 type:complete len:791 (+) comp14959_c0_seq3:609-2981(+)